MNNIRNNLIEIKRNVFVSKNDPDFLRKYVQYNPTDSDKLFEYAKELESKGETVLAFEYLNKASQYGSKQAKKILEKINSKPIVVTESLNNEYNEKKSGKKMLFLPLILLLLLLSLGVVLYYLFSNILNFEKASETTTIENNTTNITMPADEPTKEEELIFSVVLSSIEYYKKINSVYPSSVTKLEGSYPENYVSNIPSAYSYSKTSSGYKLTVEGMKDGKMAANGLINLVYYEKTKQLGLLKGDEVIKLYDVAYGSDTTDKLPSKSIVSERVSNPNGGNGTLGTRGLALSDNFAIHGTNKPDSIGNPVTAGCLRLSNDNIEELYPFVPLGTPFKVNPEDVPSEPTISGSLPSFPGISDGNPLSTESNPSKKYDWKR